MASKPGGDIGSAGGMADSYSADVTSLADLGPGGRSLPSTLFGGLDGLVHNATSRFSSVVGPPWQTSSPTPSTTILPSRSAGAFNCAKAALPPYASGTAGWSS